MYNSNCKTNLPKRQERGFNVTEVTVTTAMVALLGSIGYPSYLDGRDRAKCSEAQATLVSIPPVISAYIDETGEAPKTWEDISNIAVVMTNNGPASGNLTGTPINLPRSNYELLVEASSKSEYLLTANCFIKTAIDGTEKDLGYNPIDKDKLAIKSCFNFSNGASDTRSGKLSEIENKLNCG